MAVDFSFLPKLPIQVDEVIQDVHLFSSGTLIHYVVDPMEIMNFCFPAQRARRFSSWQETVCDIIALYEVFYGYTQHPILLDECNYELVGAVRYFTRQAEKGLESVEYLTVSGSENLLWDEDTLVAVLAVVLGVSTEGFIRLKDLLTLRFFVSENGADGDDAALRRCFSENSRAPDFAIEVAVRCFNAIVENYQKAGRKISEMLRHRYRNSVIVDAQAVSRLLKIQEAALQAHDRGELRFRHVFYYVSSADRTEPLFKILEEQGRLPYIDGRLFSAWRTPRQILLRLICSGKDEGETLHGLAKIREIIEVVRGRSVANLDERALPSKLQETLVAYQSSVSYHHEQVKNFGLGSLLSTGAYFHRFLTEKTDADEWMQNAQDEVKKRIEPPQWEEQARELSSLLHADQHGLFCLGSGPQEDSSSSDP